MDKKKIILNSSIPNSNLKKSDKDLGNKVSKEEKERAKNIISGVYM